jgi:hypothetical protein
VGFDLFNTESSQRKNVVIFHKVKIPAILLIHLRKCSVFSTPIQFIAITCSSLEFFLLAMNKEFKHQKEKNNLKKS